MNRITALGAIALLAVGLSAAPAAAAPVAHETSASINTLGKGDTCPKDGKIDVEGNQKKITITAPEGKLITGYCVKAGSAKQGLGPEYKTFDPPVAEVTIKHSSCKDISHYTVTYTDAPGEPTPTPTEPEPEPTPSEPSVEPSEPEPTPSEPSVEPSEPVTEPSEPGAEPSEPVAEPTDEPSVMPTTPDDEVLASTGAGPAIGYTLLALALAGGGAALLVLRRRRMS
ncbi:hypothetical protein GCM10028784_33880 [Myceligenerans cantabricum]